LQQLYISLLSYRCKLLFNFIYSLAPPFNIRSVIFLIWFLPVTLLTLVTLNRERKKFSDRLINGTGFRKKIYALNYACICAPAIRC